MEYSLEFWGVGGGGYHLVPQVLTIFQDKICFPNLYPVSDLGQVIQRVDNDIPWINHCQVDKWYQNKPFYLLDSVVHALKNWGLMFSLSMVANLTQ